MPRIEITSAFKRDYRRVRASPRHRDIEVLLSRILDLLVADDPLPAHYRDHPLTGDWHDHRDCHVKPDLVLIYRKPSSEALQSVRLGSHSDLRL
jgi:mRNA interferase YafQ